MITVMAQRMGVCGQLVIFGMRKKAIAAFRKAIHLSGIKLLTPFVSLETHSYFRSFAQCLQCRLCCGCHHSVLC